MYLPNIKSCSDGPRDCREIVGDCLGVAEQIKKEFDKRHGPTWHCIVGRNFGNFFLFIIVNDFFTWVYSDLWFISLFSSGN